MRDSLVFRGSAIWNVVNCNDKIDNLNFKEIVCEFTPHYVCRSAEMKLKYQRIQPSNNNFINVRLTCPDCNGG